MQKFNMQDSLFGGIRHRIGGRIRHRCGQLLLVLLIVTLAGCSSVRLSYNFGDTVLYWWINGYVGLESDQKSGVTTGIDKLFAWHRQTQLKEYVILLQNGQRQLQGNPTQADLLANYSALKDSARVMMRRALPELSNLARSLQPGQIASIEKKFASNNNDYRDKYLTGNTEKRKNARYESSLKQFELWFGSFSREQEAVIRKASDARPQDAQLWFDERILRQKKTIALLQKVQREKLGQEATMALIGDLIDDSFRRLDQSEHKAAFDASTNGTLQMIMGVIAIVTPAQKEHVQKQMQDWIDDFNRLAADT
jgi:hypothetical protein